MHFQKWLSCIVVSQSFAFTIFEGLHTHVSVLQRFIQYMASRNTLFNLSNFLDKSGLQGESRQLCTNFAAALYFITGSVSSKLDEVTRANILKVLHI